MSNKRCRQMLSSHTVDGQNPAPVEVGSLSHYLQGFIHTRRLFGISSINSSSWSFWGPHSLKLLQLRSVVWWAAFGGGDEATHQRFLWKNLSRKVLLNLEVCFMVMNYALTHLTPEVSSRFLYVHVVMIARIPCIRINLFSRTSLVAAVWELI